MTKDINNKATSIKVKFVNKKVLEVEGPKRKMDHALTFLQQLVSMHWTTYNIGHRSLKAFACLGYDENTSSKTYVVLEVTGADVEVKRDSIQSTLGDAGKTTSAENLHFSFGHADRTSSASEAMSLAEYLAKRHHYRHHSKSASPATGVLTLMQANPVKVVIIYY